MAFMPMTLGGQVAHLVMSHRYMVMKAPSWAWEPLLSRTIWFWKAEPSQSDPILMLILTSLPFAGA